jgi:hypothetical protein
MIDIENQGTTAASTLVGGAGVTLATALNAGLPNNGISIGAPAAPVASRYIAQITSAQTLTLTRVQ